MIDQISQEQTWVGYGQILIVAITLAAILLIGIAFLYLLRSRGQTSIPVVAKPLMTKSELIFYHRLIRVCSSIGNINVFTQVAMGAIIDARPGIDSANRISIRNRFDRKIIDFVLTDQHGKILLLVELDDPTHNAEKDRLRDEITRSAGYKTIRIRGMAAKDDGEIKRILQVNI